MFLRRTGHSLVVHAPAKLNVFLEVLAKRPDGFHELETLIVSVGLYDTLTFAPAADGEVHFDCVDARSCRRNATPPSDEAPDVLPTDQQNLVVRAAELLRQDTGATAGVRMLLQKRIPLAAGLGGGSSDAAATLAALNQLWDLNLSAERLHELAGQLGSDVPFFLADRPAALCRGRGEIVQPLDLPLSLTFVVVRPQGGLSTAEVYRHCRPAATPKTSETLVAALRDGRSARAARCFHNALQLPAQRLSTEVCQLCTMFSRLPVLGHQLSGSGTSYFGMCAHRRQAQSVAARLRAQGAGRVYVVQCRP